ncbi:MAG: acetyl-CoA carboxylase biotin carboxyl carrier protein subunit [Bacteroides sp.]|nr:acetyl-CoA carboxylase biotin carboxyl carrier protein subunit [Bacteroides sp.]MCM1084853.1 acetyl-CoA carboxylase biotin carboxyl carrier protein subunit [Bacteroides sp.]MCM1168317.1 acetyl-CoA carboxylase biotin carboxyl carrier protein subunit [Bacteroides sp.]MCM1531202.1 acetyl-CoA carboxylase biotin carboxyl carrier protein subunit [Ruminococcus flavefaciens]MCM1555176.1 acetyl-CoA carboxylase biotin carboxyl carrier protein subunit [Bacteroides sp.]
MEENMPAYRRPDPYRLEAFMPGTIQEICVKVGDKVKKGQKVLVLDAMKMDNELLAAVDGVVKNICVEVGKSIPKHALLIEFAPVQ